MFANQKFMVNVELRFHPNVLFAYSQNYADLILRVENPTNEDYWAEADVLAPEKLSLSPDSALKKGRVRIGIVGKNEFLEKAIKVYANVYTNPQMYRCKTITYIFTKNGVIDKRLEKTIDIRCELKKASTL